MKNFVSVISGIVLIISNLFPVLSYSVLDIKFNILLLDREKIFILIGALMLIFSDEFKFSLKIKIVGLFFAILGVSDFFIFYFLYPITPFADLIDCVIEIGLILFICGVVIEVFELIIIIAQMIPVTEIPQQVKKAEIPLENQEPTKSDSTESELSESNELEITVQDEPNEEDNDGSDVNNQNNDKKNCILFIICIIISLSVMISLR
jgi:hypothetical protein